MKTVTVTLKSVSPYGQSRYHDTPKLKGEGNDDCEKRTWRNRLHADDDGNVFIPPMAFKNCIASAAKYKGEQIPGKGKRTYTKLFESGIIVEDCMTIGIKKDEVEPEILFLPSTGVRGDGKRVKKYMPRIPHWEGQVTFILLDDQITKEVFITHLEDAGRFIGLGFFRPERHGYWGRFTVEKQSWS